MIWFVHFSTIVRSGFEGCQGNHASFRSRYAPIPEHFPNAVVCEERSVNLQWGLRVLRNRGEMAERLKATVSKTVVGVSSTKGSNPFLSAIRSHTA